MDDGGRSVLFASVLEELRISSTSSSTSRSGWTSVRFSPPASRRESPAARSAARYLEVGGCGGTGWTATAAPGRGGRKRRRRWRWRSRVRYRTLHYARSNPIPSKSGSDSRPTRRIGGSS